MHLRPLRKRIFFPSVSLSLSSRKISYSLFYSRNETSSGDRESGKNNSFMALSKFSLSFLCCVYGKVGRVKNCAHITTARGSNVGLGRLLWNARRNEVLHTSERGRGINNARYKQADKGGAFVGVGNSQVCERKRERERSGSVFFPAFSMFSIQCKWLLLSEQTNRQL